MSRITESDHKESLMKEIDNFTDNVYITPTLCSIAHQVKSTLHAASYKDTLIWWRHLASKEEKQSILGTWFTKPWAAHLSNHCAS